MANKKAIMNTIESLFAGILLFLLLMTYLSYTGIKVKQEKIDINELIYDTNFRNAIISGNETLATDICNLYYSAVGVTCNVTITDLSFTTNKTFSGLVYNIFISGNETLYEPKIARVVFQ